MKLTPATPAHAPLIFELRNQPHVRQFNEIRALSVDDLASGLRLNHGNLTNKQNTVFQWIAENDARPVGYFTLRVVSWHDGLAEIGYCMLADVQGKGFCTAAVGKLIKKAFCEGSFRRLIATAACDNTGSWKVLEKNGFIREGLFREHYVVNGYALNYYAYGLLRSATVYK